MTNDFRGSELHMNTPTEDSFRMSEPDYICSCCGEGFYEGYEFENVKFCQPCVKFSNHLAYLRDNVLLESQFGMDIKLTALNG